MQHSSGNADDEHPTPEEIAGQELRRLRTAQGWSQEQVAERMKDYGYDWHQTQVGRIESAQRPLRLNEAVDLAALFGIPLEMLLTRLKPELDTETLDARIAETEQRLKVARQRYSEVHALWEEGTAELARLGPRHTHTRQVMEKLQGELDMLSRLRGQPARRTQNAGEPPA